MIGLLWILPCIGKVWQIMLLSVHSEWDILDASSACLVRKEKVTSVEDGAHLQQLMPLSEA